VFLPSHIHGEMFSREHEEGKRVNQEMFLLILEVIRFLIRQGLPLRGDDNDAESNFIQFFHLYNVKIIFENIKNRNRDR